MHVDWTFTVVELNTSEFQNSDFKDVRLDIAKFNN